MGRPTQGEAAKGGGGGDHDNGSRGIDRNGDVKRQEGSFRRGGRSTMAEGWRETLQRKQQESGVITWWGQVERRRTKGCPLTTSQSIGYSETGSTQSSPPLSRRPQNAGAKVTDSENLVIAFDCQLKWQL
ncbi:unnamed protein product [Pleuronectes platessa]|uniref:Uncharacterized protein n=1 Tax=Pleuronectes platessa TaxID=8262 RepID=A0A9N7ZBR2_PLEPL|nr:unnamed protein product [Pleuronectes platessa]